MLRRVFVVGHTGVGKSTYARALADALGPTATVVSGGGWVREQCPSTFADTLTAYAMGALQEDPDVAIKWVGPRDPGPGWQIVEGLRNPRDFALLCDPKQDVIVVLSIYVPATNWERIGSEAVHGTAQFMSLTWGTPLFQLARSSTTDWDTSPSDLAKLLKEA